MTQQVYMVEEWFKNFSEEINAEVQSRVMAERLPEPLSRRRRTWPIGSKRLFRPKTAPWQA